MQELNTESSLPFVFHMSDQGNEHERYEAAGNLSHAVGSCSKIPQSTETLEIQNSDKRKRARISLLFLLRNFAIVSCESDLNGMNIEVQGSLVDIDRERGHNGRSLNRELSILLENLRSKRWKLTMAKGSNEHAQKMKLSTPTNRVVRIHCLSPTSNRRPNLHEIPRHQRRPRLAPPCGNPSQVLADKSLSRQSV